MPDQALITFGDGLQAYYYDEKNVEKDRRGVEKRELLIVPSQEIIDKYRLTEEHLNWECDDGRKGRWIPYPVDQIWWMNRSKIGAHIIIFCSFSGAETELMQFISKGLLTKIKLLQTEKSQLKAQIYTQQEFLDNVTTNPNEMFRKIKEMYDFFEVDKDKEDEDD